MFQIDAKVTASIAGLTITGGTAGVGGGLYNNGGSLTLTDCTVSGNSAMGPTVEGEGNGGGLDNNGGMLSLIDCTVSGNSATNEGGGLFNFEGTLELTNCTFVGNTATVNGGGLLSLNNTATLTNCTISGNTAFGGGGLYNLSGTTTLTNCTVSGNTATDGGGLFNFSTLSLTNCTVVGNSATKGGGLYNYGGTTALTNSIVARQSGGVDILVNTAPLGGNSIVTGNYNLIGDGSGISGGTGNLLGSTSNPIDPHLAPLDDYGGPSPTMLLLNGSPAIHAGTTVSGVTTDQRGFPVDAPNPDIGAFQVQSSYSLVVKATGDSGAPPAEFDLRGAINIANLQTSSSPITFDPAVFGTTPQTIILTGHQLELSNTTGGVSITGPAVGVTVSGGGASRVFQVDGGVTATFSDLTITRGSTTTNGAGLYNQGGTVSLTNCTVSSSVNTVGSTNGGGLCNNGGTLTLTNCTVAGNSAPSGGGLSNLAGTATLTDCTISGNDGTGGGGLARYGGTLTLTNCTVVGNSSTGGGGVSTFNGGTLTLTNCTVTGNTAAAAGSIGGVSIGGGAATLTNTIVTGNSNGDIGGGYNGTNNLIGAPLTLAPLGDYGGPTATEALLPGSPAIGAGTPGPASR